MQSGNVFLRDRSRGNSSVASAHQYAAIRLSLLLLTSLVFVFASPVLAQKREPPMSFSLTEKIQRKVDLKILPKINSEKLIAEDRERGKNRPDPQPLRIAVAVDVNYTLQNSGTWDTLDNGARLWRLSIQSPGANNLSLGITRFDVPAGAKLWVYDPEHIHFQGPYTLSNRSARGRLWTPLLLGSEIDVELFVPVGAAQPIIEIGIVNHGYRGLVKSDKSGIFGQSEGGCNNDVICPAGNAWRDQIQAVAAYTLQTSTGTAACTGQLLNNTAGDFKPYFLSAHHCEVDSTNDDTVVVFWNFDSPTCGTHAAGDMTQTQTGTTFRASFADSDFLLLELSQQPDPNFHVFYGGWDASGTAPTSAVCIHHPSADVKAISFSNSALTTEDFAGVSNDHWRVDWSSGVTEPGSSGSCVWDTDNKRCVGQLHGGPSACGAASSDLHDFFGKFSVSWNGGGTAATRLKDWLDPGNSGTLAIDGAQPSIAGGPVMRIEQTTLDYGQVELGFSFIKAIVIHNDGSAPLTVSVSDASPASPDLAQWPSRNTASSVSVASLGSLVLQEKFVPLALGSFQASMTVTSDDPAQPSATVLMKGSGISPIPIDSTLVLDRSGSMNETAGLRRKIDALGAAVDLYANLLRPNTGGTGDKIGLVKYNQTPEVYVPFDFADINLPQINTKTDAAALADPNGLLPQGSTGIGGGMQSGASQLPLPASSARKHVMVVLTDGIENTDPRIDTVLPTIHSNDPALRIYSIGLGSDINPSKLQEITNVTNGYHQVSDDLSGPSLFDLETFYFKIFANATDSQIALDPTRPVTVTGTNTVIVDRARITSSDHRATFLVLDLPSQEKTYDLQLLDPNGNVIGPGSSVGGVPVQIARRNTFTIYKVAFPSTLAPAAYVGDWVLRLQPKAPPVIGVLNSPRLVNASFRAESGSPADAAEAMPGPIPPATVVQIGFAAAVGSDYRLDLRLPSASYLPGSIVTISASMTEAGWPSQNGRLIATITMPDHSSITTALYDDGTHGDAVAGDGNWTGQFGSLAQCGTYRVFVRALGHNSHSELVIRESTRYISLTSPACEPNPCPRSCKICCVNCPEPGGQGGTDKPLSRLFAGALIGANWPVGSMTNSFDSGFHFTGFLESRITPAGFVPAARVGLQLGYHEFGSKLPGTVGGANSTANLGVTNISVAGRLLGPTPFRPFVLLAVGGYHALSVWKPGVQVGAGVDVPVARRVSVIAQTAYHSVATSQPGLGRLQWLVATIGLSFAIQ
jgi:hypothetical protein